MKTTASNAQLAAELVSVKRQVAADVEEIVAEAILKDRERYAANTAEAARLTIMASDIIGDAVSSKQLKEIAGQLDKLQRQVRNVAPKVE